MSFQSLPFERLIFHVRKICLMSLFKKLGTEKKSHQGIVLIPKVLPKR